MNVVGIIKVFLGKFYFTGVEFAMKLRILIFVTLLAVGFSSACFSHKKKGNLAFLLLTKKPKYGQVCQISIEQTPKFLAWKHNNLQHSSYPLQAKHWNVMNAQTWKNVLIRKEHWKTALCQRCVTILPSPERAATKQLWTESALSPSIRSSYPHQNIANAKRPSKRELPQHHVFAMQTIAIKFSNTYIL